MTEFLDIPLLWDKPNRDLLTGSWVLDRTIEDEKGIKQEYDRIFPTLIEKYPQFFDSKKHTFEEFKWAWALIWSNAFNFEYKKQPISSIVPMGDFLTRLNEDPADYQVSYQQKCLIIRAHRDYPANTRIFNDYTKKGNLDILRLNGYLVPKNKNTRVPIRAELDKADPLFKFKDEILEKHQLISFDYPYSEMMYFVMSDKIPKNVISFCRVFVYNGPEKAFNPNSKLNTEHEEKSINAFIDILENAMASYPTKDEEDEALLKTILTKRQKLAITLRLEEKKKSS